MQKNKQKQPKLKVAVIGLGGRGIGLLDGVMYRMRNIEIVAVCDVEQDRIEKAQKHAKPRLCPEPKGYTDYTQILKDGGIDCVIISTSWCAHSQIANDFMRAGIPVGVEVGGAYSVEECWDTVRCYEETKTPYMMLENCCYGEYELAVLKMVQDGVFGEVVHCSGGYKHDIRDEIAFGNKNKHYRLNEYINRNCENYPTHEIGPISKVLNLTYGNTMVSLTSTASKACGLKKYIETRKDKYDDLKALEKQEFCQGDIVTTVIKCAGGETITITLDTTLPRIYSRGFEVRGTRAMFSEDERRLILDKDTKVGVTKKSLRYTSRKYGHPIWKYFKASGIKGGHGGMDWLVLEAFFASVRNGDKVMPIDVYEAASWMVITALSAKSIESGSVPVEFPDFTNGAWKTRKQQGKGTFFLEK